MVGLSLDEYLASEPSTTLMDRRNVVAKILKQAVKRPSNKTIAKRTGLTVNQVEYVFRRYPELREMRIEKVSKSLKQMAYDTIEAHQETIADLRTQLAEANERVGELSLIIDKVCSYVQTDDEGNEPFIEVDNALGALLFDDQERSKLLNKFAIDKKIEGIQRVLDCRELNLSQGDIGTIELIQEQLRKEQE